MHQPRPRPRRRAGTFVALGLAVVLLATACGGEGATPAERAAAAPPPGEAARLSTPVLSARRAPELLRSTITGERIREALAPVLAEAPAASCLVVSTGGRVVVAKDAAVPMAPASTLKILTGTAVLEVLDPDSRLTTTAAAARAPSNGVIDGDLYLIGGGDPILTTAGYKVTFENPEQLSNDFGQLADRIWAAGVREIRGGIVGDESRYDTERWVPTWPQRYQREGYVGPLSALVVNDGSTGLSLAPDVPARVRMPGEPALLAAETLKTLLESRGVRVSGEPTVGRAPERVVPVATLDSPPIGDLVGELITDSDNTTAELLVKELGHRVRGDGSTQAGLEVMAGTLSELGLPTAGLELRDGSGLDPADRVTCGLLVAALDRVGPDSLLGRSLPIAGRTGTLRKRMRSTAAEGRVRAKTGTLAEVSALAGFAVTGTGTTLTFAYLINGPDQTLGVLPLDELAAALVSVPDGPPIERLAPRPAGA
jgi:D-alanyl-D-alanine carboxypeptidase/D-alanyl-D-alanine-endopeptidase (penicillin-binding protein 4)